MMVCAVMFLSLTLYIIIYLVRNFKHFFTLK